MFIFSRTWFWDAFATWAPTLPFNKSPRSMIERNTNFPREQNARRWAVMVSFGPQRSYHGVKPPDPCRLAIFPISEAGRPSLAARYDDRR